MGLYGWRERLEKLSSNETDTLILLTILIYTYTLREWGSYLLEGLERKSGLSVPLSNKLLIKAATKNTFSHFENFIIIKTRYSCHPMTMKNYFSILIILQQQKINYI